MVPATSAEYQTIDSPWRPGDLLDWGRGGCMDMNRARNLKKRVEMMSL